MRNLPVKPIRITYSSIEARRYLPVLDPINLRTLTAQTLSPDPAGTIQSPGTRQDAPPIAGGNSMPPHERKNSHI